MRQYLLLFFLFLQVGCLGYAEPWGVFYGLTDRATSLGIDAGMLLNLWGINTILPGGFMLNYASFLGFSTLGLGGAVVALLSMAVPAFVFAGVATYLQQRPQWLVAVQDGAYFLRLTALGLFLAALFVFVRSLGDQLVAHTPWHIGVMAFLALATCLGTAVFRLRAWVMLLLCGLAGILLF